MPLRSQFEEDCSGRAFTYYPPKNEEDKTKSKETTAKTEQSTNDDTKSDD